MFGRLWNIFVWGCFSTSNVDVCQEKGGRGSKCINMSARCNIRVNYVRQEIECNSSYTHGTGLKNAPIERAWKELSIGTKII